MQMNFDVLLHYWKKKKIKQVVIEWIGSDSLSGLLLC